MEVIVCGGVVPLTWTGSCLNLARRQGHWPFFVLDHTNYIIGRVGLFDLFEVVWSSALDMPLSFWHRTQKSRDPGSLCERVQEERVPDTPKERQIATCPKIRKAQGQTVFLIHSAS